MKQVGVCDRNGGFKKCNDSGSSYINDSFCNLCAFLFLNLLKIKQVIALKDNNHLVLFRIIILNNTQINHEQFKKCILRKN